ncbi:MAG TPA: hypothetical protein VML55_17580 [Planctomycetaceae bacterium]|nr:hypothetical protein [Planctomycetaceae bacterium]
MLGFSGGVMLAARVEEAYGEAFPTEEDEYRSEPPEEERLSDFDRQRIESLFESAAQDRARAFELKQELDRLKVFKEYEDRFLDLFRPAE